MCMGKYWNCCEAVRNILLLLFMKIHVQKGPSDFKEAVEFRVAWKSARAMSGAPCAMIGGVILMLEWPADNWDSQV